MRPIPLGNRWITLCPRGGTTAGLHESDAKAELETVHGIVSRGEKPVAQAGADLSADSVD